MITRRIIVLAATLAVYGGCVPEKRIVWTSDGARATVATRDALRLIDATGRVLKPSLPVQNARCVWTADNRRLLVASSTTVAGWNEVAKILTDEQREFVIAAAAVNKPRIMNHEGDWDHFEFEPPSAFSGGIGLAMIVYLRDVDPEGLAEKLGDKWTDLSQVRPSIWRLQVYEPSETAFVLKSALVQSLDEIFNPELSPDEKFVSFTMHQWNEGDHGGGSGLYVAAIGGGDMRLVDGTVGMCSDWSRDGRQLAYIRCTNAPLNDNDALTLGSVATVTVRGADGALLKEWSNRQDRIGLIFNPIASLRWLRDGRILFASVEMKLPATKQDMPRRWTVFAFDPNMPAGVMNVLGRDFDAPLDPAVPLFEVSPDQTRLLLPCVNGQAAVYDIAEGATMLALPEDGVGKKTILMPTWRGNDEICIALPRTSDSEGAEQWDVALRTAALSGEDRPARAISRDWPEDMRWGWLIDDRAD